MKRLLLLLSLLPLIASAQLQLFVAPQGGEEKPVSGIHDLGSVAVADSVSVRFRLRNMGTTSSTLSYLYVSGSGFSMTGAPSLPYIVAPGVNVDFTVRFSPPNYGSYSANLQMNSTGFILRASGLPGAAVRVNGQDVPTDGSIDFGRVERGSTASVSVAIVNPATEPVTIPSLSVSGSAFTLVGGNPAPFVLRPAETRSLQIVFTPAAAGIVTATLTIDKRSFKLTGSGFEPAMPRPSVLVSSAVMRSGEQGRVSIQLASASRANAKGQLRLEVRPSGTIRENDSGAMFVSGSRTLAFDVAAGDTIVKLRGEDSLVFQTGTTAGTLVIIAEVGGFTEQASVTVAPEAVRLEKAAAVRNGSSFDVQLTGFDNTRTLGDMSFTFYSNTGQPLPGMPIRVPVNTDFDRWWNTSTLGGIFQVKAAFPVTGDASKITGVEVQLTNASGTTSSQRIAF